MFTPHLAFWSVEARARLCAEATARFVELLRGDPLTVLSSDPRLAGQTGHVVRGGWSHALGRHVGSGERA